MFCGAAVSSRRSSGSTIVIFVAFIGSFVALMAISVFLHMNSRAAMRNSLLNDLQLENAMKSGTEIGKASLLSSTVHPSIGETVYQDQLPWDRESTITVRTGTLGLLHSVSVLGQRRGQTAERQCLFAAQSSEPLDVALTISGDFVIGMGGEIYGDIRSPEPPGMEHGAWNGQWIPMPEGSPERAIARIEGTFDQLEQLLDQPPKDATELFGAIRIEPASADSLAHVDTLICFGPVMIGSGAAVGVWSCSLPKLLICLDDFQVSGSVLIEGGSVILSSGEVRLLDHCRVGHSLVFGATGCIIADQARARGQVISGGPLQVVGEAMVGPWAIVASRDPLLILDNAWVNGSAISLNGPIHINADARVDGVAWSGGSVTIDGTVRGSIVAARLNGELRGEVSYIAEDTPVSPFLVSAVSKLVLVDERPEIIEMGTYSDYEPL